MRLLPGVYRYIVWWDASYGRPRDVCDARRRVDDYFQNVSQYYDEGQATTNIHNSYLQEPVAAITTDEHWVEPVSTTDLSATGTC